MSTLLPILGLLLLGAASLDIIWSTLSLGGGGPVTRRLGAGLWRLSGGAAFAGPLILAATAAAWVGLLWFGWTLVFTGAPLAVIESSTRQAADHWDRLFYAGYTVATLGLGDFIPQGALWQVLTVLAAFTGLVLITLGVTYYGGVLSAVAEEQQFAALIAALGEAPTAIVANAWNGRAFEGLDAVFVQLAPLVTLHAQRHLAYPVIHYFRPTDAEVAIAVQTARLGEALVLLRYFVAEEARPAPAALGLLYRSLETLLHTLHPAFIGAPDEAPPLPDISRLRAAGIPLAEGASAPPEAHAARRLMLGFVHESRFAWSDVDPGARA